MSVDQIKRALTKLDSWIESENFRGWDPFDALNSPLLKRIASGNRWIGIALVQLFKRCPINLRPLFRVSKDYNPKGMGLFLTSYLRKYQMTNAPEHLERIRFFAEWLQAHTSPGYSGACWGYNFDWPNRGFFAPAGTPTVVNTAFIALAFLEVYRALCGSKEPVKLTIDPLDIARSACDFVLEDLNVFRPAMEELCFSYTPLDRRWVHNANMLGAWLLAEVYTHTNEARLADYALAAARFTSRRQQDDGSWPYGEGENDDWVDNFHTGFVLIAFKRIASCLKVDEFNEAIIRGYHFWRNRMFLGEGAPKYYPDQTYPIDTHCVAQAILTFLEFADLDSEAMEWAKRVASWGIGHMQDPQGYFYYQIHRNYCIRIPYMRWSQAWMQRALTELLFKLQF